MARATRSFRGTAGAPRVPQDALAGNREGGGPLGVWWSAVSEMCLSASTMIFVQPQVDLVLPARATDRIPSVELLHFLSVSSFPRQGCDLQVVLTGALK